MGFPPSVVSHRSRRAPNRSWPGMVSSRCMEEKMSALFDQNALKKQGNLSVRPFSCGNASLAKAFNPMLLTLQSEVLLTY
jgi:hypothetical protein